MIEIKHFNPYNKGCCVGFFDIFIHKMGIELNGCSLNKKDNQKWINVPSKEYKNKEGLTKYAPIFRFINKEHHKLFKMECLKAIETYLSTYNTPQTPEDKGEDIPF